MSPGRLQEILHRVKERLAESRARVPLRELVARAADQSPPRSLAAALRRGQGVDGAREPLRVVGELKRRSPSAGAIFEELDPAVAARELQHAGCAALSVLTEPDFFGGSLQTLAEVREVTSLPLLRKDFLLDVYQVAQARAFGADAVLLLASVADDHLLTALRDRAGELGMEALAEAHDARELDRLLRMDFPVVGVNARDLSDFSVDLEGALRRLAAVPSDRVAVAESGVRSGADARRVADSRADAALVGEALMRGGDPRGRFAELFGQTGNAAGEGAASRRQA